MNARALRPANVAAGAVLLAGILMIAIPQHALSIVQITIVAIAAAVGLHALAVHLPTGGWISPFQWGSPFEKATRSARSRNQVGGFHLLPSRFSGVRYELDGAPPLPPKTLRLLQTLIRSALDLDSEATPEPADEHRVTPLTWSVLRVEVSGGPLWRRWLRARPPNPREVASVIEQVLDDLDRLSTARHSAPPTRSSNRDSQ